MRREAQVALFVVLFIVILFILSPAFRKVQEMLSPSPVDYNMSEKELLLKYKKMLEQEK